MSITAGCLKQAAGFLYLFPQASRLAALCILLVEHRVLMI